MTIQSLKIYYLIPLNLRVSSVVRPHSFWLQSFFLDKICKPWTEFSCSLLYFFKHVYILREIRSPCLYTINILNEV